MINFNSMINKSIHSLAFSLITASSLVALSSSSYAMDPPQIQQPITEIAKQVQVLKNLEAQLQKRKDDYEAARIEFSTWNESNDTQEEVSAKKDQLNEDLAFCKGLINVAEGDIKTQKTLLRKQQLQQLNLAKKEFLEVIELAEYLDSWENKSDLLQRVTHLIAHGTKLMEEVESSLSDDREVQEKLQSVKYLYSDVKGLPEYLPGLLQQIEKLKEAEKNFTEAMKRLNDIDSSEDREKSFNSAKDCQISGGKLMEEVQSSDLMYHMKIRNGFGVVEALQLEVTKKYDEKFSLYPSSTVKIEEETKPTVLQQIEKLDLAEKSFNAVFPLLRDFDTSENKSDLLQIALSHLTQGENLIQEVESSALDDSQIDEKLKSVRIQGEEAEGFCKVCKSKLPSEEVVISPPLPTMKIEEEEKSTVLQRMEKLKLAEKNFHEVFQLLEDFDSSENKKELFNRANICQTEGTRLMQEVNSNPSNDSQIQDRLIFLRGLQMDAEGLHRHCSALLSESVVTSSSLSGVKIEEEEKPVVETPPVETTVPQILTVAAPVPAKPEEVIPAVMTVPAPVVRPTLERGTPPPPGPLVSGQKGRANKPATGNLEVANPQTPKGPATPNPKAPPADLMEEIRERQRQRAANQSGDKTPIPQISKDVPQIEKPTKGVFRLRTPTKKDRKGDSNVSTLSSDSVALQDDLSKLLSPTELEVQTLEFKLAGLPNITMFANLELQDKTTAEEKHNAEKAAIFEKLKVALTKVVQEKADALKKLQDARHALSQEKFEELSPIEISKKEKERDQQRKVLNAKIKIAEKEYTKSFAKEIESKIQCFAWKNEESMRKRAICKSNRVDLKSILEKREDEIQKKREDYKSQWRYIDERREAGDKVNVLQPLRFKAGELLTEIETLEKLQEGDEAVKSELRRLIKYSKNEVEENKKQIGVLENEKQAGPFKKTEESAAPDMTKTLSKSFASKTLAEIAEQNATLPSFLDQSVVDLEQDFENYNVTSNSLTPEQKAEQEVQEAEERARNLATAKAAAEEKARYEAEQDAYNRAQPTDLASLKARREELEKRGAGIPLPLSASTLNPNNDEDDWSD